MDAGDGGGGAAGAGALFVHELVRSSLAPSYVAVAWLYGYTVSLWTHNVYVAPAVFSTLRYGLVWLADDVRAAPVDAQMRVHVSHLAALFLGVIVGTAVAIGARTRADIDASIVRGGRLRPLGALWLLGVVAVLAAALIWARCMDTLFAPGSLDALAQIAALLAAIGTAYTLLVCAAYLRQQQNRPDRRHLYAPRRCAVRRTASSLQPAPSTPPAHTGLANIVALCALLASADLLHAAACSGHATLLGIAAAASLLVAVSCLAVSSTDAAHTRSFKAFCTATAAGYLVFAACTLTTQWNCGDGIAATPPPPTLWPLAFVTGSSVALLTVAYTLYVARRCYRRHHRESVPREDAMASCVH